MQEKYHAEGNMQEIDTQRRKAQDIRGAGEVRMERKRLIAQREKQGKRLQARWAVRSACAKDLQEQHIYICTQMMDTDMKDRIDEAVPVWERGKDAKTHHRHGVHRGDTARKDQPYRKTLHGMANGHCQQMNDHDLYHE